jgi:hypothetical protein
MSPTGARNRDSLLIAQLAGGATHEHAATAVGCSRRTVSRKIKDPKFCAQLDEARRQLFEAAFSRINAAGQAAASTSGVIPTEYCVARRWTAPPS